MLDMMPVGVVTAGDCSARRSGRELAGEWCRAGQPHQLPGRGGRPIRELPQRSGALSKRRDYSKPRGKRDNEMPILASHSYAEWMRFSDGARCFGMREQIKTEPRLS